MSKKPVYILLPYDTDDNFRKVKWTGKSMQVVTMTLLPGEKIPYETHDDSDQAFLILEGSATVIYDDDRKTSADKGEILTIRQGVGHEISNRTDENLVLVTFYSKAQHSYDKIQEKPDK